MSQSSHDLSGFEENIILSNDSQTGLSEKVADMGIDGETDDAISIKSDKSGRSVRSARSGRSVGSAADAAGSSKKATGSAVVVKKEKDSSDASRSVRQPRAAAVSANKKMGGKRKFLYSSDSDDSSSYNPTEDSKPTPGSATKKKKNESSSEPSALSAPSTPITRITHVVQTAKNGRVVIEGLLVTKKTGQVFYPQDSIFVFRENDESIDAIKELLSENKKKWIENGHSALSFSHTFNGALPTVVGGFTRGFAKSIFK